MHPGWAPKTKTKKISVNLPKGTPLSYLLSFGIWSPSGHDVRLENLYPFEDHFWLTRKKIMIAGHSQARRHPDKKNVLDPMVCGTSD